MLTDVEFFGGLARGPGAARAVCGLPVLRKDFTVDRPRRLRRPPHGRGRVLLIAAALDDAELAFHALARDLGLDALVEIHDEAELERALAAGATWSG